MAKTKTEALTVMPNARELEALKAKDEGYQQATKDIVAFLNGRRQAIYNIARSYHLDTDELYQEAYEVLLTCVRDYSPIYQKRDGDLVSVLFTTFFGNRLENRAMELRNRDPEYQARQAMTDGMTVEEKERFRSDPPLLVQHLDHESTLQEALRGEVSEARAMTKEDVAFRIARDSFFDRKLAELVAREKDEKKQAALLHVKVGGVYNFQEIAYHFGVTDSRASQVMNELMDAFYVQRLIDRDLDGVAYDFDKLKFNEKRILRLLEEAISHAPEARAQKIVQTFEKTLPKVAELAKKARPRPADKAAAADKPAVGSHSHHKTPREDLLPPAYEEVFSEKENKKYPLIEVGLRPVKNLHPMELDFRPPEDEEDFAAFVEAFDVSSPLYPVVVSEDGAIIDGERRIRAAQAKGRTDYLCLTRKVASDEDGKLLRVVVNMRLHGGNKTEMYYAIRALSSLGMSQQKIADHLGTSRTNVLVYCKVRDKADPQMRALFEDGLIQITNAATCVDLDSDTQQRVANFIRQQGKTWSKGAKFNRLFEAASAGTLDKLEQQVAPGSVPKAAVKAATTGDDKQVDGAMRGRLDAMQKQLESYAVAMRDAEIWAAQREGVINNQREQINQMKSETESLKRELEATELMRFGNPRAVEEELQYLKQFYIITERMAGATHAMRSASADLGQIDLRRKQIIELTRMMEEMEKTLNAFRVELHNRAHGLGVKPSA